MTVSELIQELSNYDPLTEVRVTQPRTEEEVPVTGVDWIVPLFGEPFLLIDDYPHK